MKGIIFSVVLGVLAALFIACAATAPVATTSTLVAPTTLFTKVAHPAVPADISWKDFQAYVPAEARERLAFDVLKKFETSLSKHDAAGLAALFSPDVSITGTVGNKRQGAEAIRQFVTVAPKGTNTYMIEQWAEYGGHVWTKAVSTGYKSSEVFRNISRFTLVENQGLIKELINFPYTSVK